MRWSQQIVRLNGSNMPNRLVFANAIRCTMCHNGNDEGFFSPLRHRLVYFRVDRISVIDLKGTHSLRFQWISWIIVIFSLYTIVFAANQLEFFLYDFFWMPEICWQLFSVDIYCAKIGWKMDVCVKCMTAYDLWSFPRLVSGHNLWTEY